MTILGIRNLTGGLNNQRLAMLGLLSLAKERNVLARFPSQMVDFVPRDTKQEPGRFFFPELFDINLFQNGLHDEPISREVPTETVPFSDLLPQGFGLCMGDDGRGYAAKFMQSLKASCPLQGISTSILKWLADRKTFALQLRIERDWKDYISRSLTAGNADVGDDIFDPSRIFSKIRQTKTLDGYDSIWACCDEDDLIISTSEIKEIGKRYDLNVLFKSDLPNKIVLPDKLLMRSMVDYTVCTTIPVYVGLTRSSFSRTLTKEVAWGRLEAWHYAYNTPGNGLLLQYSSPQR